MGMGLPGGKCHLRSCSDRQDRAASGRPSGFSRDRPHGMPGKKKIECRGFVARSPVAVVDHLPHKKPTLRKEKEKKEPKNAPHPAPASKEVPPAEYESLFLNHSGLWRGIVPFTSLSEMEPGHKTPKKSRNAKFTSKSRETAKNGGCGAKFTFCVL